VLCRALLSLLDTCLQLDLVKHHYCAVIRSAHAHSQTHSQDRDAKVDDSYCALLLGSRPGGGGRGLGCAASAAQGGEALTGSWAALALLESHRVLL